LLAILLAELQEIVELVKEGKFCGLLLEYARCRPALVGASLAESLRLRGVRMLLCDIVPKVAAAAVGFVA